MRQNVGMATVMLAMLALAFVFLDPGKGYAGRELAWP
jgi:hypothetical protein